ncbi:MAG: class I SAM-dependent methyltransferase family protein [Sulfolobales archaeon]
MGSLLRDIAREVLGESLARRVWKRVEIIGDIAVLRKPLDLDLGVEAYRNLAVEIMNRLPYVKSVWLAVTPVGGSYRIREFVHLAGELRSETIYKEHGCLFRLDITKVYVSPALNYEHARIAKLVKPGEEVLNMFAGVGLFSIIIAKYSKPKRVISVDINPDAFNYMVENVKLNNVSEVVVPVLGDAREVARSCAKCFDRILMPLPELAYEYLEDAVLALRDAGVIHAYEFVTAKTKDEALLEARNRYLRKCESIGVKAGLVGSRVVRSVGPRYYQVVLDLQFEKIS